MNHTVSHLFIYPVKSLGGIALDTSLVESRGLQYDRRYMLVDENLVFITQRQIHRMALLKLRMSANGFTVFSKEPMRFEEAEIPAIPTGGTEVRVKVWEDECPAVHLPEYDDYFSKLLERPCRLVYMPETSQRQLNLQYARLGEFNSFSDGYPILIAGSASLDDLNQRLSEPIEWERFRPNVVVRTLVPFEEDRWREVKIGSTQLRVVKPCARCVITTIDQDTAQAGKEPLRTLAGYRLFGKHIMFAQNAIPVSINTQIKIGDALTVLKSSDPNTTSFAAG